MNEPEITLNQYRILAAAAMRDDRRLRCPPRKLYRNWMRSVNALRRRGYIKMVGPIAYISDHGVIAIKTLRVRDWGFTAPLSSTAKSCTPSTAQSAQTS